MLEAMPLVIPEAMPEGKPTAAQEIAGDFGERGEFGLYACRLAHAGEDGTIG
jgi:hypothetical protein